MTDPLTLAIAGSITSKTTEAAINWIQARGPEIEEKEWEIIGYQIGNELTALASHLDHNPDAWTKMKHELESASIAFQKLSQVGDDFGFNHEIVAHYEQLSKTSAHWLNQMNLAAATEEDEKQLRSAFQEYKSEVLPKMK